MIATVLTEIYLYLLYLIYNLTASVIFVFAYRYIAAICVVNFEL